MKGALVLALVCAAAACAAALRPEAISSPSRMSRTSTLDRLRAIRRPASVSADAAPPAKKVQPIDPKTLPPPNGTDPKLAPKVTGWYPYYPVNIAYSYTGLCAPDPSQNWATVINPSTNEVMGSQVADNLCTINATQTAKGRARASLVPNPMIGGSTQWFLDYHWLDTHAWQAFTIPPIPSPGPDGNYAATVDALQLGVVLNVGATSQVTGDDPCQLKGVWYQVSADNNGAPTGDIVWEAYADLTQYSDTWQGLKFTSNTSTILTFDAGNIADGPSPMVLPGSPWSQTKYWLYVQFNVDDYSTTKQCLAFWGTTASNGKDVSQLGTWMEQKGGAGGYATTCTEDPTNQPGPAAAVKPGPPEVSQTDSTWVAEHQVLYKCFNQGTASASYEPTATSRRCVAYRRQFNPVLECPAPLKYYLFNMFGFNGWAGAGQGGLGK